MAVLGVCPGLHAGQGASTHRHRGQRPDPAEERTWSLPDPNVSPRNAASTTLDNGPMVPPLVVIVIVRALAPHHGRWSHSARRRAMLVPGQDPATVVSPRPDRRRRALYATAAAAKATRSTRTRWRRSRSISQQAIDGTLRPRSDRNAGLPARRRTELSERRRRRDRDVRARWCDVRDRPEQEERRSVPQVTGAGRQRVRGAARRRLVPLAACKQAGGSRPAAGIRRGIPPPASDTRRSRTRLSGCPRWYRALRTLRGREASDR